MKNGVKNKSVVFIILFSIYINIYIRGVTVHRMYGPVRYDTVVSQVRFVFDMGGGRGGGVIGYVTMLEIFLF